MWIPVGGLKDSEWDGKIPVCFEHRCGNILFYFWWSGKK